MLTAYRLVLLAPRMIDGPAAEWAVLGMMGAVACTALAGALQAVDGIALKAMVNSWAAAHEPEKAMLFQPACGVRQIEIGFASITGLLSGLTLTIYGIAFLIDRRFSRWIGVRQVGGAPLAVGGVVTAYTGFSGTVHEHQPARWFLDHCVDHCPRSLRPERAETLTNFGCRNKSGRPRTTYNLGESI